MIVIVKLILVATIVKGIILIYDNKNNVPPPGAGKKLKALAAPKKVLFETITDTFIFPVAALIEPFIKISPQKRFQLQRSLSRAEIDDNPEMYYAKAVAWAIYSAIIPILFFMMGARPIAVIMCAAPPIVLFDLATKYRDVLSKKKKKIELALPAFIRAILYKLNSENDTVIKADLIGIFEDYNRIAPPEFTYDISILVIDMKAISVEAGLNNFSKRLGIPEVHQLSEALIGITRGEHQNDVLAALAREMDVRLKENTRKELEDRPGKVVAASIPLFLMGVIAIFYVFVSAMMQGIGGMF